MSKVSIQYKVLGIEPTAFKTRASSHNHYTRVLAIIVVNLLITTN